MEGCPTRGQCRRSEISWSPCHGKECGWSGRWRMCSRPWCSFQRAHDWGWDAQSDTIKKSTPQRSCSPATCWRWCSCRLYLGRVLLWKCTEGLATCECTQGTTASVRKILNKADIATFIFKLKDVNYPKAAVNHSSRRVKVSLQYGEQKSCTNEFQNCKWVYLTEQFKFAVQNITNSRL